MITIKVGGYSNENIQLQTRTELIAAMTAFTAWVKTISNDTNNSINIYDVSRDEDNRTPASLTVQNVKRVSMC